MTKISLTRSEEMEMKNVMQNFYGQEKTADAFFNYCSQWKLAPWIYTNLQRLDLFQTLPQNTRERFREAHEKVKNENEARNAEAVRFLSEFNRLGIPVAILKGNLFAHTVNKDTGYKRMNDFDILIHVEDWDRVQEVYFSLGYIPLGFGWSGEKQKAAKFSHVGMSFISENFKCIIGTQWGLKSPTTSYKVNIAEAWSTARDFEFYGVPVKQLSPEYNLLHLVLHMGIYKCGIRDCMDVYNYLLTEKIDSEKFYKLIKDSKAIDKAYFTLSLSHLCSGTHHDLLEGIKPGFSFITRRLAKRKALFSRTGDFQDAYNDYFQDIEKVVIYFNLFPKFHKKLIFYFLILKMIFFPGKKVALKFIDSTDKDNPGTVIVARIKAPGFVFSLIAQEIGWKFTFLLFLKLFIDLISSIKNYFIKKESYFDYLKRRGIDPRSIEKAVKNIQ